MRIYIVWKTDYSGDADTHILGIYKKNQTALTKCYDYNENNDNEEKNAPISKVGSDGLLGEFSGINNNDVCFCSRINVDDNVTRLYFIKINEDGGGGSYHNYNWIYVCTDMEEVIECALDYFSNEHNRDDDCEDCIKDKCKKQFINDLKKKHSAGIDCTDYDGASIEIWKVKI